MGVSVNRCSYGLSVIFFFERWAPSMPEALQGVGARLDFHRLGVPGLPAAGLQGMCCVCVVRAGQGSQRPGPEQVL